MVNIIRGGLRMQVSEQMYESIYKPNGWAVDDFVHKLNENQEIIKSLSDEEEIKNFIKMKNYTPRKFDDKLFKSEDTG